MNSWHAQYVITTKLDIDFFAREKSRNITVGELKVCDKKYF